MLIQVLCSQCMPRTTNMVKQACGRPSYRKGVRKIHSSSSTVDSSEAHFQVPITAGGMIAICQTHACLRGIWIIGLTPSKSSVCWEPVPLVVALSCDWPWHTDTANVSSGLSPVGVEEMHHLHFADGTAAPAVNQWRTQTMTCLLVVFRMDSPEHLGSCEFLAISCCPSLAKFFKGRATSPGTKKRAISISLYISAIYHPSSSEP